MLWQHSCCTSSDLVSYVCHQDPGVSVFTDASYCPIGYCNGLVECNWLDEGHVGLLEVGVVMDKRGSSCLTCMMLNS